MLDEFNEHIDKLERELRFKKYQYKEKMDIEGGWSEAKKMFREIKKLEKNLEVERKKNIPRGLFL